MRALIGGLILGLCASATAHRAEDCRTDQALWSAAVRSTPRQPRPAANLADAYLRGGDLLAAAHWARHAARLADQPAYRATREDLRRRLSTQVLWIDGALPVCHWPDLSALCASWR